MPPGRATGREQRPISHTEVVFRLHQAVVAAFHDVAQRPRRAVHDVHVLEDDEIRRDLRQVDGSDNDLVVALRVHRQHDQVVPQIVLVQERPHRGGPDLDVDDECFQIRNPVLVLKDVLQRQRRDLTRERGRTRLVPGGRSEAASVAARRGINERVVYGVKRDHAVPVRDRPVHDRDAVRRIRVRGDECREVPVDAWLRLDQHGVVDHVEREPLERVVGVAEREVRPDLQHGTAAPRPRERRDAVQEAPFCPVWTREADAGDV